jgi:dipeptidyl aminopeptidase/acylaminoacyl peptidase
LRVCAASLLCVAWLAAAGGCRQVGDAISVRPKTLRDVPAARLAFRFEPDVSGEGLPPQLRAEETDEKFAPVKTHFENQRKEEELLRTVVSPDGQRVLALYATKDTESDFRIDLYSADGSFVRNILPPEVTGRFLLSVSWSPDGQQLAFIGVKNPFVQPTPEPAPDEASPPAEGAPESVASDPAAAQPTPSAAPLIPPVPVYSTEQIYIGDRDGFNLRPLTTRDGLIYFKAAWAPDGHAIAALGCKADEFNAQPEEKESAGRPRLILMDGRERLLDDRLTDAPPVWSPDSSKVATAFDKEIVIYDVLNDAPTAGSLPLTEPLRAASVAFDTNVLKATEGTSDGYEPLSFNPVVRLEWAQPETLFVQTAYVRYYQDQQIPNKSYPRWHLLHLSPQATVLN